MKSYFRFIPRYASVLALFLTLFLPSLAHAATLNVPTAAYPTIQAAIQAAANGDTVLVAAGTYSGPGNRDIDFGGKSLTVTSQAGAGSTIIDCGGYKSTDGSGNHRGFYIHSGEKSVTISGFTVKNGYEIYASTIPDSGHGGGICIEGSSAFIQSCIIFGNTGQAGGGGIYNHGSNVINGDTIPINLTNCTLTGNAAGDGGGIFNFNGGPITLTNCTITDNTATRYGGGIYNNYCGTTTWTNCTISGNTAQSGGGGIYDQVPNRGTTTLTNCAISDNTSPYGGAIFYEYPNNDGAIALTNCTITGDTAQYGAIYTNSNNGQITLINDIVHGDTGGEIYNENGSSVVVSFSDIQGGNPGTGNINADPQFVNAAYGDLHLKSGSPCIGVGTATGTSATDKDGNLRANAPSMGAYEGVGGGSSGGGGPQRPTGSLTLYDAGYYAAHTDLSDSAASSVDIPSLMTDTKLCDRAVADGATKVLLRYNASAAGTVAFTRTNGVGGDNLRPVYGTNILNLPFKVTTQLINGQNVAFAIYTVPESLDGTPEAKASPGNFTRHTVSFQATFTPDAGTVSAVSTTLSLENPPVLLVHGLNSSPQNAWGGPAGTATELIRAGYRIFLVDYSSTNNSHFNVNQRVLLDNHPGILDIYDIYRSEGIAITKVDVVAHSMGGLVTREFAGWDGYSSTQNFHAGYVRRFITMGTPHFGSPVAKIQTFLCTGLLGGVWRAAFSHTPLPYGDAVFDLQPGGAALAGLLSTNTHPVAAIPCYAEAGDSIGTRPADALSAVTDVLLFAGYSVDGIFNGEPNDVVVGETSADGGLSNGNTNLHSNTDHLQETSSQGIAADVVQLLSGPLLNFDTKGFRAVGPPAPRLRATRRSLRDLQPVPSFVTVTTPTAGQIFRTGDTLTITVTPNVGTTLTQVLISAGTSQQTIGSALVSAAPFRASFTIPSSYLGDLPITVVAQDNANHICNVNGDVFVQTNAALASMAVTAVKVSPFGAALLTSQGSTNPLTVTGTFSDGVKRDTTLGALGTRYTSSDPTIATVSTNGLLTALANGNITIAVTNGTITATEKVIVQLGTPNILNTTPSSAIQGATVSLALTGTDLGGASQVQFLTNGAPDPNITVTNIQTNIPGTSLTATVTIKSGAVLGVRTIIVTTPGGLSDALAAPDAARFLVQSSAGHTHMLWNNTDGRVILWSIAADSSFIYNIFGPYNDGSPNTPWHATALATGPNGLSHILWTNPDGKVILWSVDDSGNFTYQIFGPYTDGSPNTPWSATSLSVGADNVVHILWTNPDHRVILWNVDSAFNFTYQIYGPYDDGSPSTPWNATAIATGSNNVTRLVWNNPDGRVILWNVDSAFNFTYKLYGPYTDGAPNTPWSASAVSVGADGVTHLLWTNPDRHFILWNLDSTGSFTYKLYGPYTDGSANTPWSATALATGPDNLSHLLWTNPDNRVILWGVNSAFDFTYTLYGPYTDGAAQNIWSTTAISAGP